MSTTGEPSSKRLKMSGTAIIGTHNGHFHADEALAVYLLRLLPQYAKASLVRTRDAEKLKACTIVVDVGGVHDDSIFRYDHHQREFKTTFPNRQTKLSSAGLVWMHFGKRIVAEVTGKSAADGDVDVLWEKIYDDFVEAFDGNDNGVNVYDSAALRQAGIKPKFSDRGFSIASVVNRFNYAPVPAPPSDTEAAARALGVEPEKGQEEEDVRFASASAFVGQQFSLELDSAATRWLPARAIVKEVFDARHTYDPKGRIIIIPYRPDGVPWSDHLYALEKEAGVSGQVLYALFAENGEVNSKWRIRTVSLEPGSFESRKALPEPWRGVRDEELSKLSGVPGCIFVHAAGFMGGNQTFEGALSMAQQAVDF